MPEDDVLYTDVKFARGKANETTSSSPETTYSEVNILKTQQPAELPAGPQQPAVPNERSKVTAERVALLVLGALLAAAVTALGVTLYTNSQTLENLKNQNEALKKNLSERVSETKPPNTLQLTCPNPPEVKKDEQHLRCEGGWEQHGEMCYLFSNWSTPWTESRDRCKQQGGDLVKIDSEEEQRFLAQQLREKMSTAADKFWIGLTDSKTEGEWLWVDGSRLDTSLSYWSNKEPDNWTGDNPDGEDCVRMGEKGAGHDLKCWFDKSCEANQKSICEKQAKTQQYTITCLKSS
ncbi:CD209 antigen-like protein E [Trachinotus anak]|uniref:CD209 antigen-like protein E n=1 Tax=Trachinotus anak TaxID=443729 RepID=UPI0039F1EB0D